MDTQTHILIGLSRISTALRSHAWREAMPRGLTPTQVEILGALRAHASPLRAGQLAERLAITPQTVTDALTALERKGLVRRDRSPDDGRALAVRLTEAGREAAEETAAWPDALAAAVDALSEEERKILLRSVVKVILSLQEQGRIAPSRMCVTCRFFRPNRHADPDRPHHCALVDAPFGDAGLRVDCAEHEAAGAEALERIRELYAAGSGPWD